MSTHPFQAKNTLFVDGHIGRILILVSTLVLAYLIARLGHGLAIGLSILPLAVGFLIAVFFAPRIGLLSTLITAFVGIGMKRYIAAPTGLLVDSLLLLTFISYFFRNFRLRQWGRVRNGLCLVVALWFAYNVFELFNPESPSTTAWFYAMRGVAGYMILAIPLALLIFTRPADWDLFIALWLLLSCVGFLWGMKQLHLGLDAGEKAWLSAPGNLSTHILFGKLRVFSFYTDAGQFGAAQAHAGVVAIILALGPGRLSYRVLLASLGIAFFYGMMISGTRGAVVVPVAGFMVYFLLGKNWKILILGLSTLFACFAILKYTHIGHGSYEVRRIRAAVRMGSEVPSLQVRLENQEKLKAYLESRPFGGGVGSAGYWGKRFSPGTFLANLALDSWYVKIAAEQGPVGLALYLLMIAYILGVGLWRLLQVHNPAFKQKMLALYSGLVGVLIASYGNQVLGQMPTGIVAYTSIAFLFAAPSLSAQEKELSPHTIPSEQSNADK